MKKILLSLLVLGVIAVPALVSAQADTTKLNSTITSLTDTVNLIIPLMLAVAVVVFIYGVIRYILAEGEIDRNKAVGRIVWSVVAIAAILAVWGLARLLIGVLDLDDSKLKQEEVPGVITPSL